MPAQCLWVLGDNAAASADSTLWGALPEEEVVGRVVWRLWPSFGPIGSVAEPAASFRKPAARHNEVPELPCAKPGNAAQVREAQSLLRPGVLLKATTRNLDSKFKDSTVLLVDIGQGGAIGLTLGPRIGVEELDARAASPPAGLKEARLRRAQLAMDIVRLPGVVVRRGGPVEFQDFPYARQLFFLHPFADVPGALPATPPGSRGVEELFVSAEAGRSAEQHLEALRNRAAEAGEDERSRVVAFVGRASWGPLQLAAELRGLGAPLGAPTAAWEVVEAVPTAASLAEALSSAQ